MEGSYSTVWQGWVIGWEVMSIDSHRLLPASQLIIAFLLPHHTPGFRQTPENFVQGFEPLPGISLRTLDGMFRARSLPEILTLLELLPENSRGFRVMAQRVWVIGQPSPREGGGCTGVPRL